MLEDLVGPVELDGLKIYLHPEVYVPAEDTYLLVGACQELARGRRVLDIGCGTGIVGIAAAKAGATEVVMIDINPYAAKLARINAVENGTYQITSILQSDMLECLNSIRNINLIAFNPPYLPETRRERWVDHSWAGGPTGGELIDRLIRHVKALGFTGEILMTCSSLTMNNPIHKLENAGFKVKVLDSTHKFFETIYLIHATRG